jgi:tetratricopeptide (TPR) repeat protein
MGKIILTLFFPALSVAGEVGSAGSDASSVIEQADRLETAGEYEKAIALSQSVQAGREADVLWRISRAYSDMGDEAPEDRRAALFDRAIEYGRKGVEAAPRSADAHAILAVALGRKALYASAKEGVRISKEVKAECERAIALDPGNFLAHLVLGIWHREVADLGFVERAAAKIFYGGLPDATLRGSAGNLERAVYLQPDSLRARYELGVTYWEMGEKEKARTEMEGVARRRVERASDRGYPEKARKLLEKFGK